MHFIAVVGEKFSANFNASSARLYEIIVAIDFIHRSFPFHTEEFAERKIQLKNKNKYKSGVIEDYSIVTVHPYSLYYVPNAGFHVA